MKKFYCLLNLIILILLCGCSTTTYEDLKEKYKDSNVNNSDKVSEYYKVELKEETKKINNTLSAKIVRAIVSNDSNEEAVNKINTFLNQIVDDSYNNFEGYVDESVNDYSGYIFDYEYSLVNQTENYLIFKLDFKWQAGGPYPTYAEEYFMFHKDNGKTVFFDELFTEDLTDKVYDNVVNKINEIYKEYGDKYNPEENELKKGLFNNPGFYVLNNGKLSFSLPKGYFTSTVYGSLTIDIDEDIYKKYIK